MPVIDDFGPKVLLAWKGELSFSDLVNAASALDAAGLPQLSAALYQTWVTHTTSPYLHAAYFNLGASLSNLGELATAESAYRRAIEIAPTFMHPRLNLGLLFERQGKVDDALAEWQWIDKNSTRDEFNRSIVVSALNHLGRVLETKKQFADSLGYLTRSLHLQPDQADVLHHWVFSRQKQCAWPVYLPVEGVTLETMQNATSALAMLSVSDDPLAQLTSARRYVEKKLAPNLPRLAPEVGYGHKKIRIGYCSSDLCLHPVAMLTVQMFELHNRDDFEIFGFCWSPEDGSALRHRVIGAMDHFFRIQDLSDEAAAQLIRSHEIDVLVDLQGQTSGARANILGYRPAPIQITYLGLPATTAIPNIDYVIADAFLIPSEQTRFYSEKPLYMPHVYQVSDRSRPAAEAPTRQSCGLPEDGFIFCSFNNSYKYTPDVFDVWMRLLLRVPGSVLWLLADNPWAEENLYQEAQIRGVSSDRLVFANRVSPENYLARYHCADLFLDTFPFNAGTTANDCLWMGCPLLTMAGRSFASRMAGALLTAAGLAELIAYNLTDYEDVAVRLANDSVRCLRLREHLSEVRDHGVLFDTPLFVRSLEVRLMGLVDDLPHAQLST
jgi:predicted O-linked N-acetylglucosamine transferase (SPINDLY family)